MKKKTTSKKAKNKSVQNFTTTKNLRAAGKWVEARFDDLIRRVKKGKSVSENTKKITLNLDQAEYESIIDGLERGKKNGFLEEESRQLKKENRQLDMKLDDKAYKELLRLEWAQNEIPKKGATLRHYRNALQRAGINLPRRGKRETYDSKEVLKFHGIAVNIFINKNQGKALTTDQKNKAVKAVKEQFKFASIDSTRKYLTRLKAKNLPWGK